MIDIVPLTVLAPFAIGGLWVFFPSSGQGSYELGPLRLISWLCTALRWFGAFLVIKNANHSADFSTTLLVVTTLFLYLLLAFRFTLTFTGEHKYVF